MIDDDIRDAFIDGHAPGSLNGREHYGKMFDEWLQSKTAAQPIESTGDGHE